MSIVDLLESPDSMRPSLAKVLGGEYNLDFSIESPTIIDLGANLGSFTIWVLLAKKHSWTNPTIHCYEPNPETFKSLQRNLIRIFGAVPQNVYLHNLAVGDTKLTKLYTGRHNIGECSLYSAVANATGDSCQRAPVANATGDSCQRAPVANATGDSHQRDPAVVCDIPLAHDRLNTPSGDITEEFMEVTTVSAANLPAAHIVKIDTEGSEVPILQALQMRPMVVLLEYHSEKDRRLIDELLKDYTLVGGHVDICVGTLKYIRNDVFNQLYYK